MGLTLPPASGWSTSLGSPHLPVELNDVDVDRMLPHVLELAVRRGRAGAADRAADPALDDLVERLVASGHLDGFDGPAGRAVLRGWLTTSVVRLGRRGRGRTGERVDHLRPRTVACYRSGLPLERSRNRRADLLVHHGTRRALAERGVADPDEELAALVLGAFGTGVDVGDEPWHAPRYDGTTELDATTLLSLRLAETFPGTTAPARRRAVAELPVPGAVLPLGRDVLDLLATRPADQPAARTLEQLASLVQLRLLQLPLRTAGAMAALLAGRDAPDVTDPAAADPCEQYLDFTRRRGGPSDELSARCVLRDLDVLRSFFRDRMLLRQVQHALAEVPDLAVEAQALEPPQLLQLVAARRADPRVAAVLERRLAELAAALPDDDEGAEGRDELQRIADAGGDAAGRTADVLVSALGRKGMSNQVQWYASTGGLGDGRGLLAGTRAQRTTWRYAPGDALLRALLALCFAGGTDDRLPVTTVLQRLHRRFGLLVDRPPAALDSAEARAGAAENLDAFTRRLQLMGCFHGLSDDLGARVVTDPRRAS